MHKLALHYSPLKLSALFDLLILCVKGKKIQVIPYLEMVKLCASNINGSL